MTDRDSSGQFAPGNHYASVGGHRRAAVLSPDRRREIARAGWLGLVTKRFAGDERRAADYIGQLGAWTAERTAYAGTPLYKPDAWRHPDDLRG